MFTKVTSAAPAIARALSTSAAARQKVAVLGGAGGIGQPLSLLLKNSPLVTKLAVYDVAHAKGVAADLSHISSPAKVEGFVGAEELGKALTGAKVVVIPAGVPRKPGMTRDDLFNTNASIVAQLAEGVGKYCPDAVVLIISNPVNSTVAIAAEVLKKAGVYNPKKIFGVTTLDIVRARTFVAERKGLDVTKIEVPVIGGHAGGTILPLLSRVVPKTTFTDAERDQLTLRIQNGGTEVVEAKAGTGSATLSMAQAGLEMTEAVIKGLNGQKNVAITFLENDKTPCKYFAVPVELGPSGAEKIFGLGELSAYETEKLNKEVYPELIASIAKGEKFVADRK